MLIKVNPLLFMVKFFRSSGEHFEAEGACPAQVHRTGLCRIVGYHHWVLSVRRSFSSSSAARSISTLSWFCLPCLMLAHMHNPSDGAGLPCQQVQRHGFRAFVPFAVVRCRFLPFFMPLFNAVSTPFRA